MQTNQLSIFEMVDRAIEQSKASMTVNNPSIPDIRSEKQKGKSVSYDVGEKIGGARKDLESYRTDFLAKPSIALLQEIEKMDVRAAADLLRRSSFFSWFSLEDCKERGVAPGIAKAIQLFINRIPKESDDSQEAREKYTRTLLILSAGLHGVKTIDDYHAFEKYISALYSADYYARKTASEDRPEYQKLGYLMMKDLADNLSIKDPSFKGPFWNYFYKHKSRVTALKRVIFEEDWENVLPSTSSKKETPKKVRKAVWSRELPDNPSRNAGDTLSISTPESFAEYFGFRSVEFGNWVEDEKAKFHLQNAAEAYADLSVVLSIPTKAVSLDGTLAMAFGSRGSGKALGHYESAKQVINLTKVNGSLGILAHEWFHALDSYLFNASHEFENGKIGFLSKDNAGAAITEVQSAMNGLLQIIKEGKSTAYIDVRNAKSTYRVPQSFEDMYKIVKGNLQYFMDVEIRDFDYKVERQLSYCVSESHKADLLKKLARKRVRFIRSHAEALSDYHFNQTGERVHLIPYTTNRTAFLQNSINMDKNVEGKYWSSNVELVARAFESYVASELEQLKWTSDYLVCGAYGSVYPEGEERERIHAAMAEFIESVRTFFMNVAVN